VTKLKIEHFENDMQMRTYMITEADGKQDFCYEDDGDYKAIRYLQRRLAESNQLQELLVAKAAANYDEQQRRIAQLEEQSQWVSVEDDCKPELHESVWIYTTDCDGVLIGSVAHWNGDLGFLVSDGYKDPDVTHWKRIDPPAKEQES
jgi:hypothetical protein